jgi:hypothetical protein
MAILGNGSQGGGDTLLRWYADRADGELPRAVVFSLPVLSYRLFMLLWSLLLAVSLVGYLPWAYRAFSAWGLWRPIPPLFRRRKAAAKSDDDSVTQAIEIDRSPASDPDPTPDPK